MKRIRIDKVMISGPDGIWHEIHPSDVMEIEINMTAPTSFGVNWTETEIEVGGKIIDGTCKPVLDIRQIEPPIDSLPQKS